MSETEQIPTPRPGASWRNIRQEVQPVALSRRGRRRRNLAWLKYSIFSVVCAVIFWAGFTIIDAWENDRAGLAAAAGSGAVRNIVLVTDGTLTKQWIAETLALPKASPLMALDLAALKDRLTAHGQISVAVLTRRFPGTLLVTIRERNPVARIQLADGSIRQLLVAKDGTVYEGFHYEMKMLAGLPWLDGVSLKRLGKGYAPVAGMDAVSRLLSTAQLQAPHLYREWTTVSLARLEESSEIVVKAQDIEQIVFSCKEDFFRQVAQLDYVIDAAQSQPDAILTLVNLTLGSQVAVKFDRPAEQFFKSHPNITTQKQGKGKRDL